MRAVIPFVLSCLLACHPDPAKPDDSDPPDTGDTAGPSEVEFDDLDALIEGIMDSAAIPGLGASLMVAGEVVWAEGYGWADIDGGIPATADTAFMLASVSKTFVATAVMQQVEQGIYELDTPVNDLIEFTLDNPRLEDEVVTVRHLVTHTASLCDSWVWGAPGQEGALYTEGDSDTSLEEFLRGYLLEGGQWYSEDSFCSTAVGTRYEYSNVGADLAGFLLEATSSLALDDHSDSMIFEPLGMQNTGWHLVDHDPADVALPYAWTGGEFVSYGQYGYADYPCGQLRSSPRDMGRFLAAYAQGGLLDGERILESSTVDAIFDAQIPKVDSSQGVFWYWGQIGGRDVVGHAGGDYGVSTNMLLDPETGIGVVVLLNTYGDGSVWSAQAELERALFDKGEELLAARRWRDSP